MATNGQEGAANPSAAHLPDSWALALELIVSALLIGSIWAVDYLPTHDGPQHIYLSHVGNHFTDSDTPYQQFYVQGRPLTALGFDLIFAPLEAILPWRDALRVTLSVIVLVWAWGARTLIVSIHPLRRPLGLLGMAAALQWTLYMGFFSFVLATGVGFFVLAAALRGWPWSRKRMLLLLSLLSVQALLHVFCAGATGLVLLLVVTLRSDRKDWIRNLLLLGALGLPTLGIALYTSGLLASSELSTTLAAMGSFWPTWPKRFSYLAYLFTPGPSWRAWPIVLVAAAGLIDALRRVWSRRDNPNDRPLAIAGLVFFSAALLLPLHVRGRWEFLSPRLLPIAIIAGVALLGVERIPARWHRIAQPVLVTFVTASLLWSFWLHRAIEDRCGEALSGLDDDLHRIDVRLPIVLDTKCGAGPLLRANHVYYVEPLLNVGALYAVQQGGVVPYVFGLQPQIHPFVITKEGLARFSRTPDRRDLWVQASKPPSEQRSRVVQELAAHGTGFEDVIVWGTPADAEKFIAWGYKPDVQRGGLLIGRYEGCPTTMNILLPPESSAALHVDYGWELLERTEWGVVLMVKDLPEPETIKIPLPGTPCGRVRVRVFLDHDASRSASRGDGFCEGADETGIVFVTTATGQSSFMCEIR